MTPFAHLLDALAYMSSRNGKLRLIADYVAHTPDPARGYALAALTGELSFAAAKPAAIRAMIEERVDPILFRWSYDYVGDLAETAALIWPVADSPGSNRPPSLDWVVEQLAEAERGRVPTLLAGWLDQLDATARWALLKLVTGALRVGVSARLAKTALAQWSGVEISEIEEIWPALRPPYVELFAWLEGRAERPSAEGLAVFRPLMLSQSLEESELEKLDAADYLAEWKWDGIRVQLAAAREVCLFSRNGDSIGPAFPEITNAAEGLLGVLDGELLVLREGEVASFNDLQQRLNRKTPSTRMLDDYPAHIRLYDALELDGEDLRQRPLVERRAALETWFREKRPRRMDLSPLIPFASWAELAELRANARAEGIEGLMLKRRDSLYVAGRPKGPWFKWKRDALTLDTVLMYAQRGHGKRSSFYSDYTFGVWRTGENGEELVPVGKAYSGFTDEELKRLDKWVRDNTIERFGPVRAVRPGLVLEVAFDAVQPSTRHKSGVSMRFPRVHRIRWDKPAAEADRLETVQKLL
ncbi:MAG TPA: cisplatin damage response ATP-dependent DNA ligase [Kiloniellales bacterium]|nr:cisplatin damage response ATP-dependent DNA ligase [Kiloniellales bacterium]